MNPFSQLAVVATTPGALGRVRLVEHRLSPKRKSRARPQAPAPIPPVDMSQFARQMRALDALMERHGALSSRQMSQATGMTMRNITNNLRYPVKVGRVLKENRTYRLNPDWRPGPRSLRPLSDERLQSMVRRLRARGWSVEPPQVGA